MRLIGPITIDSSNLTSNVAESGTYDEYSAVATYDDGDIVISTTGASPTHHAYESLVDGNTGNALDDATKWLDLGATNRYAMFDQVNGTQTTNDTEIDVSVVVSGRADGVALLGLDAEQVQITVTAGAYGTVYDQTFDLQNSSGGSSWYRYFTAPITYSSDLITVDLPPYSNPTIQVQITKASGTVACGTMVIGQTEDIGLTVYGLKGGIQDYSRKETDDFGNTVLVQRAYAKRTELRTVVENTQIDTVFNTLADYRATPIVMIGADDYALSWAYGWLRDWAVTVDLPTKSHVNIQFEGLT